MEYGSAASSPSFGSVSSPSSGQGVFANMKSKAAEMKMKANEMSNNIKNKGNNLKFQAQTKGEELKGRAQNAYSELKNKRFDPSINSAADNFKAGIPEVGEKAKD